MEPRLRGPSNEGVGTFRVLAALVFENFSSALMRLDMPDETLDFLATGTGLTGLLLLPPLLSLLLLMLSG